MYRKVLTLAAILFSALAVTAITSRADSHRAHAASHKKNAVATVHASGKKATTSPPSMPPSFSDADTNQDGEIEPNEAEGIRIPFSALDMNSDGTVTHSEYDIATAPYYSRTAIKVHR
jgi:hypothetical protein